MRNCVACSQRRPPGPGVSQLSVVSNVCVARPAEVRQHADLRTQGSAELAEPAQAGRQQSCGPVISQKREYCRPSTCHSFARLTKVLLLCEFLPSPDRLCHRWLITTTTPETWAPFRRAMPTLAQGLWAHPPAET